MSGGLAHSGGWGVWLSTFAVVFAIIDPFGYVPIFLGMTARDSEERRSWMLRKACITSFAVLVIFTFVGHSILRLFGITIPALQISGGLIMLAIGFDMLNVLRINEKLSASEESEAVRKEDISIIPLAIPMLAGPASFTTVVVLSSKAHSWIEYSPILASIAATLAFTYVILKYASPVLRFVGVSGLNVLTRVMGLLLCAMAVQFIINGYLAIR